ncbi:uncharacterized mitochondrial protein AtMg00810-like [Solanum tuberosum]|uniref:uncharacterized mitochondrial protein AtMg00810-like n=1 Tax=Solanum tuberosum TaxID=4113 RepID=UPI00073A05F9|nr:PREDICTED: uncharacterized mitochondrial protein AtMg00810-like [Solanum tuberosum]
MKAYLKALSLWETIESEDDLLPLGPNPTVAQMNIYKDEKSNSKVVEKIMICLPAMFESMILAIEESFDLKTLLVAELIRSNEAMLNQFMREMETKFEMSDLGEMSYLLGMQIHQPIDRIFTSQRKYAWDILKRLKMERCKRVPIPLVHNEKILNFEGGDRVDPSVYRSLIGSLMYFTATRPDLIFAASLLSRFMEAPSEVHLGVAKQTLRYIKGTVDYGIWLKKEEQGKLIGNSDRDWAGSVDDMKRTFGYALTLGSDIFLWNSKKHKVVAKSSAEADRRC